MKRPKYEKVTVYLKTQKQKDAFIARIQNAPLDEENPLQGTLGEKSKVRGLDINGLMWKRLGEIAEQAWFNNRKYCKDVWHYYCTHEVMPEEVQTKDGEWRSKWIETPTGERSVISTTQLEHKFFCQYVTMIEAFGANLGVMFSANPRDLA